MRTAVRNAFVRFSVPMEGSVPFLYLDVKGLVTTSIGVLVDSPDEAARLPFLKPDGTKASRAEIITEWHAVKARTDLAQRGGMAYRNVTKLRLNADGIDAAVEAKLRHMDKYLTKRFREHDDCKQYEDLGRACKCGYESWNSDSQLATLSMSWACGPAFRFPKLEAALRAGNFLEAAEHCQISIAGNPGVKPRNVVNKQLYVNAACAQALSFDPDILHWPDDSIVRAYQLARCLDVDGVAGPKTKAALAAEVAV